MTCLYCGAANALDATFCGNCGRPIETTNQNRSTLLAPPLSQAADYATLQPYSNPSTSQVFPDPPVFQPSPEQQTPPLPLGSAGSPDNRHGPWRSSGTRVGLLAVGAILLILGGSLLALVGPFRSLLHPPGSPTGAVTTNVPLQNPYFKGGTLVLQDPLRDDSKGYQWASGSDCTFRDGAFHMQSNGLNYCLASTGTDFTNFAYQIQMTIIKGTEGGIVFRATGSNQLYYFDIDIYGVYTLSRGTSDTAPYIPLKSHFSSAIKQGLNQANLLAVLAIGNDITLYINRQQVARVNDSAYTSGLVGVAISSDSNPNPTEAVFQDAKVWIV